MTAEQIVAVFGWMTLINFVFYTFAAVMLISARDWTANFQAKVTGVDPEEMKALYLGYLSTYKIAILMLNLIPYIALRIVV